ncbi:FAD:protein FMN transferase [bacterium]|nr:FAD:protein FMN transferase [bacterium]
MKKIFFITLSIGLIYAHISFAEDPNLKQFTKTFSIFGSTNVEITAVGFPSDSTLIENSMQAAVKEAKRLSSILNPANPKGDIVKLNASAGNAPVTVDESTFHILSTAINISKWTSGAFDIAHPSTKGDYRHIKMIDKDRSVLLKKPGMEITIDNMAKGYIADTIVRVIYSNGVHNVMADVDGIAHAIGEDIHGPWRFQIQDPEGGAARRGITISAKNLGISTVGKRDKVVDARTKQITSTCRQVTVWSRDAADAAAFARGIYALGAKDGLKVCNSLPHIRCIIFTSDGNLLKSN